MTGPSDPSATAPANDAIAAIAVLAEPTRRRLYDWVVAQHRPVGRDEAAGAVGIARSLAAHHLDRLVESGLLTPGYRRLSGRSGPGAGRPAKLYRAVDGDIAISLPRRDYERAAQLFAEGIEAGAEIGAREGLLGAAARRGRELAAAARASGGGGDTPGSEVTDVLAAEGYEPHASDDGEIRLANCPFDALVEAHRDTVCGMNLALTEALCAELEPEGLSARLDPQPGWCCVAIERRAPG
jgi:predicted ArsR family transcriptional regulator